MLIVVEKAVCSHVGPKGCTVCVVKIRHILSVTVYTSIYSIYCTYSTCYHYVHPTLSLQGYSLVFPFHLGIGLYTSASTYCAVGTAWGTLVYTYVAKLNRVSRSGKFQPDCTRLVDKKSRRIITPTLDQENGRHVFCVRLPFFHQTLHCFFPHKFRNTNERGK